MAWKFSVLVVANVTAASDELLAALKDRAERRRCAFRLLVPEAVADRIEEAGLYGARRVAGAGGA